MALFTDLKGTVNSFFRIGQVRLKDDLGSLDVRNINDTAFVEVMAASFTRSIYESLEDFENLLVGTPFAATVSGTGAGVTQVAPYAANCIGAIRLNTGTSLSGRSAILTATNAIRLGGAIATFDALIRPVQLPTGLEDFTGRIGFLDSATGDATDGVYFEFNSSGAFLCAANNGTRTKTAIAGAIVVDDTWLRVEVNAAGTRADFYINGTNVGNITTNIPTGSGRETGWGAGIYKSLGLGDRAIDIDLIRVRINPTTARKL